MRLQADLEAGDRQRGELTFQLIAGCGCRAVLCANAIGLAPRIHRVSFASGGRVEHFEDLDRFILPGEG